MMTSDMDTSMEKCGWQVEMKTRQDPRAGQTKLMQDSKLGCRGSGGVDALSGVTGIYTKLRMLWTLYGVERQLARQAELVAAAEDQRQGRGRVSKQHVTGTQHQQSSATQRGSS